LRDCLAVCTLEAIIKFIENFSGDFEVNQRLTHLHRKARKTYFEKLEYYEAIGTVLSLMRLFPCELQQAGELQGVMLLRKLLANLRRH